MKTTLSTLLLLSAALASAQFDRTRDGNGRDGDRRDDRGRTRVEGLYTSVQRDGTVRRTLRLERDGDVEIVTEFRGKNPERDRRNGGVDLKSRDVEKYGTAAEKAARGRPVRHVGRWSWDGRRIMLRMKDAIGDVKGDESVNLPLDLEGDSLALHRDSELYGKEAVVFRRDGGWGGNGGWNGGGWNDDRPRLGYVEIERGERLRIQSVDLSGDERDARLVVRTDRRRIELRGTARRRGDEATFRTDGGELTLRMRGDRIESIRGTARDDGRRIVFGD